MAERVPSAAGQVAAEHGQQRLLGVSLLPSSRHRPQGRGRQDAEEGGQIQTGRTLSCPLLSSQEERGGEVLSVNCF